MNLKNSVLFSAFLLTLMFGSGASAQNKKVPQRPLVDNVETTLKPVGKFNYIPCITWGGDVHTQLAVRSGLLKQAGFDVKLVREDNFVEQVKACLGGKTPMVRGTIGMINAANEAFAASGTSLVPIYQHTWSNGGDTIVVREGINSLSDLKGQTIALQQYGPHVDYLIYLLSESGLTLNDVDLEWYPELYPQEDSDPNVMDNGPFAFVKDSKVKATMAIIPDALGLAEGDEASLLPKVDGASIYTSTKTNNRVIADVYAVRKDWYEANREKVDAFVNAMLKAEERLRDLRENPNSEYKALLAESAELLLDSKDATDIVEALLADCEHVGYAGNVGFMTGLLPNGNKWSRNMQAMSDQIQDGFASAGLIRQRTLLSAPNLDYAKISAGLKYAGEVVKAIKFDSVAAEQLVAGELDSWDDVDALFTREILFQPNQTTFSESQYGDFYLELLELSQANGGALILIIGHADPLGILNAGWKGATPSDINAMKANVKNLSLERARAVRVGFLNFCARSKYEVNESQFVPVGRGVEAPKHVFSSRKADFLKMRKADPAGVKQKWQENRRVETRVQAVEAELDDIMSIK